VQIESNDSVVVDCETEKMIETSVGKFFEMFKDPTQRASKGVWKLKVSLFIYLA
jgi:hypothetical protein